MLYDGAPLHVTATKASDVEQRDESVIIRPTPLVQLGRLGRWEQNSWAPVPPAYACSKLVSTHGTHVLLGSH